MKAVVVIRNFDGYHISDSDVPTFDNFCRKLSLQFDIADGYHSDRDGDIVENGH